MIARNRTGKLPAIPRPSEGGQPGSEWNQKESCHFGLPYFDTLAPGFGKPALRSLASDSWRSSPNLNSQLLAQLLLERLQDRHLSQRLDLFGTRKAPQVVLSSEFRLDLRK